MKTHLPFLAVLTALAFSFAPISIRAQDVPPPPPDGQDQSDQGASFQTFYDQLGAQGNWVQTDDYGYVFQPNVTDPNWAPYTDGHWVYTDVGWMWVSDEPWGWATYHYGRWANIDGFGWAWVPGYRWAPAWVSWRYGGGYCGWAPLPPGTFAGAEYGEPGVAVGIGFYFGSDVDVSFGIGPGCYNFVRVGDMGYPNYRGHFIDRSNNYVVINKTTNITHIKVMNNAATNFGGVTVGGPTLATVNAHATQHVATVQLTAMNQPGQSSLQGHSLAVYAPKMNPASVHQARPARISQTIAHPTFNRGDSITKPLAVTASVKPPAPTAEAIQAAKTAQLHAPAKARIVTENTPVKTPLSKPLTSLQPVAQVHRTTTAATPGESSFTGAKPATPETEHSAASAPFTGESVKPSVTEPNEAKPETTYHPETESSGGQVYHPSTTPPPTSTYHPQTEDSGGQTYHPSSTPPPATTYHPQSQGGGGAPPVHTEAAPASHPAPASGSGGNEAKPEQGANNNKPQGQ